ncbi:CAAX protease self-immunity-domain-containing protein [Gongronella butleri]|nr:CAAX protease self-immunity-domain-containing protein [Gongronella butleri]
MVPVVVANGACFLFTFLYIAGFYLRRTPSLSRHDPVIIKSRITSVSVACIAVTVLVYTLFAKYNAQNFSWSQLWHLLGVTQPPLGQVINAVVRPVMLTMALFLGPLVILYLDRSLPGQQFFPWSEVAATLASWQGFRNYIFAPLTEEYVFRSAMVTLLFHAGHSRAYVIFVSPLYFGIAHLHHGWQTYQQLGRTRRALQIAAGSSLFQMMYTTLFGWFVAFVFLRTGSIWPCVLSHAFCNAMGFPDVSSVAERPPLQRKLIWSTFVLGMLLFACLLYPWSAVPGASHSYLGAFKGHA